MILGIDKTITDSVEGAQREVDGLLDWAQRNAIAFDIAESEVVQFNGRRHEDLAGINIMKRLIDLAEHT